MKFYPCILVSLSELKDAGINNVEFHDGHISDQKVAMAIEDYCGRPVISIRESSRNNDEILVLIADGYIQYNRLSNKRTVVLIGNYDNLKVILTDIFHERPDENPYDIFCSYSYQTDINTQLDLRNWARDEYHQ